MKVRLQSDREVHVTFYVKFKLLDPLWEMETRPGQVRLSGNSGMGYELAIPGRQPEEIEYLVMKYDEKEVKIFPDVDSEGEMKPIVIYDGKRDYWSHVLRQAALGVKP